MMKEDYTTFARVLLRAQKGTTYSKQLNEGFFVNLLLCDYVCLTNLMAAFRHNEEGNRQELVQILARFSILMLGAKALTPRIVE
jgi:hypothetical protein